MIRTASRRATRLAWLAFVPFLLAACSSIGSNQPAVTGRPEQEVPGALPGSRISTTTLAPASVRVAPQTGEPATTRTATLAQAPYPPPFETEFPRVIPTYPDPQFIPFVSPTFPVIVPTPAFPLLPAHQQPDCDPQGKYTRCRDRFLEIAFEYPTAWGEITARLGSGETGHRYSYSFSPQDLLNPFKVQAGGLSLDYSLGTEGDLTTFWGFGNNNAYQWCQKWLNYQVDCRVIQDQVTLVLDAPNGSLICDHFPFISYTPYGRVFIDFQEGDPLGGFVFAAPFLSTEATEGLNRILGMRRLGWPTKCDDESIREYDLRAAEIMGQIKADLMDAETRDNLKMILHLAKSIQFK